MKPFQTVRPGQLCGRRIRKAHRSRVGRIPIGGSAIPVRCGIWQAQNRFAPAPALEVTINNIAFGFPAALQEILKGAAPLRPWQLGPKNLLKVIKIHLEFLQCRSEMLIENRAQQIRPWPLSLRKGDQVGQVLQRLHQVSLGSDCVWLAGTRLELQDLLLATNPGKHA